MTYSIVARDPQTGQLGAAVQTKVLAGTAGVMWVRPGIGAVATQAVANFSYGPRGLQLLSDGELPDAALRQLVRDDDLRAHRQVGMVDSGGRAASYTGSQCIPWAGGRTAPNVAAQGNICAGPAVVDALLETFLSADLPLAERLVRCLSEAETAGGDRRGRQAAGLIVADGPTGLAERHRIDLRVDDHPSPIEELDRLLAYHRLLDDAPDASHLLPLQGALAGEVRRLLSTVGIPPGAPSAMAIPELLAAVTSGEIARDRIGTPRASEDWDPAAQEALDSWMVRENLDGRLAASGWVDPEVLAFLRRLATSPR